MSSSSAANANAEDVATADPREFNKKTQDELDDILNSALDELEDDEDFATAGTESRTQGVGDGQGIKAIEDEEEERQAKALQTLLEDFSNPDIADSLQKAFEHLGKHAEGDQLVQDSMEAANKAARDEEQKIPTSSKEGGLQLGDGQAPKDGSAPDRPHAAPTTEGASAGPAGEFGFGGEGATDMDRTILRTLEMLSKSGSEMEGQEASAVEGGGEDIMRQMMGEFEKMGEKEDYNGVMDNIMQQLLSRELMYDPIKQRWTPSTPTSVKICDKYPEWLATHRETLSPADYQRFGKQYQSFQRVLAVYETEPENFPRLMELMQDMQEHGQVPAEIIKELAPGLEFNAEGAPIMPNVGEGMMPNLPGFPNLGAAGGDPQNCCVS